MRPGIRLHRYHGPPVDALVTHIEVNGRHGVGQLLTTLFANAPATLLVRSRTHFGGRQDLAGPARRIRHGRWPRWFDRARVTVALRGTQVERVLCVPYYADDVRNALALAARPSVRLATWLMDDQNLAERGIPDGLLAELFARSALRLAISPELRDACAAKFGVPLSFAPPLVSSQLLATPRPSAAVVPGGRPLVIGNLWGARWCAELRRTVRAAGLSLDWTSPSGVHAYWAGLDPEALAADGIQPLGALPEAQFVARLRAAPYVVVPSGTLDADDDHPSLARYSLPSRVIFAMATACVPVVVLGSLETAAARFVERAGIGAAAPYRPEALRAAVVEVTSQAGRASRVARAAALAPLVSADGALAWLWTSLDRGGPADDRFERLLEPRP